MYNIGALRESGAHAGTEPLCGNRHNMLLRDTGQHNKPHVHAYYGEFEASIALDGSAFEPLSDERVLGDFTIFHGVMTWFDGKIDIAPETMHLESFPYTEEAA